MATQSNARPHRSARPHPMVVGVAAVMSIALMVVGTTLWLDRRAAIDGVVTDVSSARAELGQTRDELLAADAALAALRGLLAAEQATLTVRQGEQAAAQAMSDATAAQLVALQQELERATADLAMKRADRTVLDTCLLGVARALNQASVGDLAGLGRTVRSIEGTCAQAGTTL